MLNSLSTLMVIAFIVESFFEVRLQLYLRGLLANDEAPAELEGRIRWSWGSWLLIIFMFVAPGNWSFLAVCIITLLETIVVMEMDHLKTKIKNS